MPPMRRNSPTRVHPKKGVTKNPAVSGRVVVKRGMDDGFWRPLIASGLVVFLAQLLRTVRKRRAESRGQSDAAARDKIPEPLRRGRALPRKKGLR